MSTRSNIAIQYEDGSVLATNCHFDGYIRGGVGEALFEKFDTQEKATNLIEGGELRTISDSDCEYYDDGVQPRFYDHVSCYETDMRKNFADYFYLFKNGQWYYRKYNFDGPMSSVAEALGRNVPTLCQAPKQVCMKDFANKQIIDTQDVIDQKKKTIRELQLKFAKLRSMKDDASAGDTFVLLQKEGAALDKLQIELDAFTTAFTSN
jgi:hypothetical protein